MLSKILLRRIGEICLVLLVPTLLGASAALFEQNWALLSGLLISVGILGLPGLVFTLMIPSTEDESNQSSAIMLVLLFWVFAPLTWMPAALTVSWDARFASAYLDTVSSMTTTGGLIGEYNRVAFSGAYLIWRSILHLVGAIAILGSAILVFANLNSTGPGVQRSKRFRISAERSFTKFWPVLAILAVTVLAFCFCVCLGFVAIGHPLLEAWILAVSATTTGIVDPSGSYESLPAPSLVWLTGALILASVNVTMLVGLVTLSFERKADPESVIFVLFVVVGAGLFVLSAIPEATVLQKIAQAASVISTSGLQVLPDGGLEHALILVLFLSFVGGTALSAAGGVKVSRLIVLGARTRLEFRTLGHPQSVEQFSYRGERQSTSVVLAVWVYLIAFGFSAIALTGLLSIMGFTGLDAMALSVGAMSNSGALLAIPSDGYASDLAKLVVAIGMLLGRLEILMVLTAMRIDFWRR